MLQNYFSYSELYIYKIQQFVGLFLLMRMEMSQKIFNFAV